MCCQLFMVLDASSKENTKSLESKNVESVLNRTKRLVLVQRHLDSIKSNPLTSRRVQFIDELMKNRTRKVELNNSK